MLQCAATPKKGYASCNTLRVTSGTTAFQEEQAAKKGIAPQTVRPNAAADSPTGYAHSPPEGLGGQLPTSICQVCGPIWPSTPRPCADWKARAALSVPEPKLPSTARP
jgi:hypothetical protein